MSRSTASFEATAGMRGAVAKPPRRRARACMDPPSLEVVKARLDAAGDGDQPWLTPEGMAILAELPQVMGPAELMVGVAALVTPKTAPARSNDG